MGLAADTASPASGDARRFAAFISYSHADADAAAKLQRKLERYRLPKRIAETRTNDATALGPIFRDREDLAAAASLSTAIHDAIGRAEALVVMCSPDAATSPWVTAEIELFRELHPDKPILAALLSGEPASSFPATLTEGGNEPLAADLRPEGDGEQLGFLKIVAGIAGVPLDSLIQRDAQRRLRRVTAITAGALAAMLIMGIMTAYAIQARNEAARQRAAAEGLVEYMLTDLREKLKGVGRLDVMQDVNRRAMEHYAKQGNLASLPTDILHRRARIIGVMGEDDENLGHHRAAQKKYRELHRVTWAMMRADPTNPHRIFAVAQSQNRLALLAHSRNHAKAALAGFKASQKLLDPILARSKIEPQWLQLAAYLNGNICAVMIAAKQSARAALSHCLSAVAFNKKLIRWPSHQQSGTYDLVFHYLWLSDAWEAYGNDSKSVDASVQSLALVEQLVGTDPENMLWREQQMQIHVRLADKKVNHGEHTEREAHLAKARQINQQLIARDSRNAVWQRYRQRLASAQTKE